MTTHNLQKLRVQDPVLTELAQGYHNNELVAETLMPTVEIEKEAGKIPTFGRLAFRLPSTVRNLRGSSNRKTGDVVVKTNGHLTATAQGGATINANTVVNGTLHATGKITSDEEVSAPVVKQGTVELGTHKHGGSPEPNK